MSKIEKEIEKIEARVSKVIRAGYDKEILNAVSKIENKLEIESMPKALQEIYNKIKTTPIEEPDLFEVCKQIGGEGNGSIIDIVLMYLTYEDMDKYTAEEISYFAGKVLRKVSSLKDDKGIFKTTPNLATWQPPKPSKIKEYENFNKKIAKAKEEEIEQIIKDYESFLLKVSGMDEVELSEWEARLSTEQTKEAFQGYLTSFLGKR